MKRIEALDGLRGLAALVVVLHHCAMVVPGGRDALEATLVLRPLLAGPQAVLVFFVLSGFVLHGAITADRDFSYPRFLAARFMRLYPPLLVAVLVSLLLFFIVAPQPIAEASAWFGSDCWATPPSLHSVVAHLLLADAPELRQLDNVTWSLSHELRICLVMPLIVYAVQRNWRAATLFAIAVSIALAATMPPRPMIVARYVDVVATARYAFLFVAGAALALHFPALRAYALKREARVPGAAVIAVAVLLLSSTAGTNTDYVTSLGAVLLVGACAGGAWPSAVLRHRALLWLGRVSYSLYLVHLVVLMTLVHALHRALPLWSLAAIAIPLSLLAAEGLQRSVERPAIRLSRRILAGRRRISAACPDGERSPAVRAA